MNHAEWVNKDFYAVLGVAKDADASAIKKAYRKLARENHPDSNPGDSAKHDRFKEVAEAYDVVGDAAKRKEYDELRAAYAGGGFPGGFGGGGHDGGFPGGFGGDFGGQNVDLGDLFGSMFGGGRARRTTRAPRRGADIEAETTIDFTQAVEGTTIGMRLTSDAPCPTCQGTGGKPGTRPHVCPTCEGAGVVASSAGGFLMNETCPECHGRQLVYDEACPTCHGSGLGVSHRTVQARIPAGVKDGQRIRLKGKGAAGEQGAPAGDLMVLVHVRAHPLFGRKGDNLTLEVPVTFAEAALGAEIKVPTLDGASVTLRIPAGTPNGRSFRVRGRGVAHRDGSKGDLLVTVEVTVPSKLTEEQRRAVEQLRAAGLGDPRAGLFGKVGV